MRTPGGYWTCHTRAGAFTIRQWPDGRWHPMFEKESLGSYRSAQAALDDLVGGHTHWPSSGVDPSTLGLPDDITDWTWEPEA